MTFHEVGIDVFWHYTIIEPFWLAGILREKYKTVSVTLLIYFLKVVVQLPLQSM